MPDKTRDRLHDRIFGETECLIAETIFRLLDGRLSSAELHEAERHLSQCPLCRDAVEGAEAHSEDYKALMEETSDLGGVGPSQKKTVRFRKIHWLAAAAILLIGLFTVNRQIHRQPQHLALFHQEFEPFPNIIPFVRSGNDPSVFERGLQYYSLNDYQNAFPLLKEAAYTDKDSSLAAFYTGISALALGESAEAVQYLNRASSVDNKTVQDALDWYKGLAWLRIGNPDSVRVYFSKLSGTEGPYQNRSRKILQVL
ncbi:hypothetical protein JW948_11600 [bacterium]|nr:hypothetical protein [bacterium]